MKAEDQIGGAHQAAKRQAQQTTLTHAERSAAVRAAGIGNAAIGDLTHRARAEAVAQLMSVVIWEIGASAAASGADYTHQDVLITRLEHWIVERSRRLVADILMQPSHTEQ